MSNQYTNQYTRDAVVPNIDEDRASRRSSRTGYSQQSSRTGYSQQPSWDSSSLSTSRTYYGSSSPSYSLSASSSRTFYEPRLPGYASQTSIGTVRQDRPNPSPALSVSSYQASKVDSGEKDNFGRVTAVNAYPIASPPAQPQYQYQQQPNPNPPTQVPLPKGLKRLFSLNRRGSKASANGFSARSPPTTSGGGPARASSDGLSRQDPVPRSSRKAQPQPKFPNVGSYSQHGRLLGEPPLPQPHQDFGQFR